MYRNLVLNVIFDDDSRFGFLSGFHPTPACTTWQTPLRLWSSRKFCLIAACASQIASLWYYYVYDITSADWRFINQWFLPWLNALPRHCGSSDSTKIGRDSFYKTNNVGSPQRLEIPNRGLKRLVSTGSRSEKLQFLCFIHIVISGCRIQTK